MRWCSWCARIPHRTRWHKVAIAQLKKGKAQLLGVVLNRLDVDKAERYYGYGKYFSYGGKYKYYKRYGYYGSTKRIKTPVMIDVHCHLLPGIDDGPGRSTQRSRWPGAP